METVIHAGGQPYGCVQPTFVVIRKVRVRQELRQGIWKTLGLQYRPAAYRSAGTHQSVARADEMPRGRVDRAHTRLQFPREAVVHTFELGGLGLAQVEVREQAPQCNAALAH